MQNQTAGDERSVNFCQNDRIVLEIKWTIWYNKNTEKKRCAQAFDTPVRAPDVRRCQRACEIDADVSDKRSIMAWVSLCDCRKVARLQCLRREDVPLVGCGRAAFRIFYLGGSNYEKETSSKCCTKMSLLRQPFGIEKCRWNISHQQQGHYALRLQQISCLRLIRPGASRDEDSCGDDGKPGTSGSAQ